MLTGPIARELARELGLGPKPGLGPLLRAPPVPPPLLVLAAAAAAYIYAVSKYLDQGETTLERARRVAFGAWLRDQGLITQEEFQEFVRSGNLPDKVRRKIAVAILKTSAKGDVDMHDVDTERLTATGQPRDARKFWRLYVATTKGLGLSKSNLKRIKEGLSPVADREWIAEYRAHGAYGGQILEHHHVEGTSVATPIPKGLHKEFHGPLHTYHYGEYQYGK